LSIHPPADEYGGERFRGEDRIQPPWEIVTLTDYRRRHALYVEDAGLQKLRSTVSMIAQWDDHEFTNNPYGNGMGADNHEPVCDGNRTSPGSGCTTDEGDFLERANRAAQAYFEWLPLRRGPRALQGQVDTDLTIVVEWGDVATFLLQDTRIEARPAHGTLGLGPDFSQSFFSIYGAAAAAAGSEIRNYTAEDFAEAHAYAESLVTNASYELLGAMQRQIMTDVFSASKAAGKVWQIYGTSVVLADQVGSGNMYSLLESYPEQADAIAAYLDALYPSAAAGTFRASTHATCFVARSS
jgi:phosphodiesterase/alkaline phosphatase D-like protein